MSLMVSEFKKFNLINLQNKEKTKENQRIFKENYSIIINVD